VKSGATLALSGGISSIENLTLSGNGVGALGAVRSLSGSTLSGTVALASEAYVGVSAGSTLTSTGAISGSVGLTRVGDGTGWCSTAPAANGFTGTTAITGGALEVQRATSPWAHQRHHRGRRHHPPLQRFRSFPPGECHLLSGGGVGDAGAIPERLAATTRSPASSA